MDYLFANSKIFRLHTIFHNAAGSVMSITLEGLAFCFALTGFPSFCFNGQVTGLLFCLNLLLKILLQKYMYRSIVSHFNQKPQWGTVNILSLVALFFECIENKIVKELGVFENGQNMKYFFLPPKKSKATSQTAWCTKDLH